jgi:hypothetical protein
MPAVISLCHAWQHVLAGRVIGLLHPWFRVVHCATSFHLGTSGVAIANSDACRCSFVGNDQGIHYGNRC